MSAINQERLEQGYKRLQFYGDRDESLDQLFREWLIRATDDELTRINAHRLATEWQVPARSLLTWLLYASSIGLFDLNWESHCRHCNGIAAQTQRLGGVQHDATCPVCHNHSEVHFDENVIVTFSISPTVRSTAPTVRPFLPSDAMELGEFSTAQPFTVDFDPPQTYFIANAIQGGLVAIVDAQAEYAPLSHLDIAYAPNDPPQTFEVAPGPLQLSVSGTSKVLVGYRQTGRPPLYPPVRGIETALLPAFQKLFSQKTLSQRESLSVRNLTILFTDITGSTALYQRLGDVRAYTLVRDHFEVLFAQIEKQDGMVVKTIGDAVMAAFLTPEAALSAALGVQKAIAQFNQGRKLEEGLILVKIGMHLGSAIAVNLNERLDYFGNMVNMAARVQGQSRSAEILLSEAVYRDGAVQRVLKQQQDHLRVSESIFELAGIDQSQRLFSVAAAAAP